MTTTQTPPRTFGSDFRRFFVRGLVILLPSVLTLWIMVQAYRFVDKNIAEPVNGWIRLGLSNLAKVWSPLGGVEVLHADNIDGWWANHWYLDLIGIIVAIVAVYFAGRLLGGFFGRRIYRKVEGVITTVPVFKQVYPHVKQVVDFLFSDDKQIRFSRVVLVEYPRKGIWTIGLLTGETMRSIRSESGDAVTVFIPSSPVPATGYTITIPRNDVVDLPISVEEAIRFTVSGGVLVPPNETLDAPSHSSVLPEIEEDSPTQRKVEGRDSTGQREAG